MRSGVTFTMTGATIDMIGDTSAMIAETTKIRGEIAAMCDGTVARGESTDGGINDAKCELPGCAEH